MNHDVYMKQEYGIRQRNLRYLEPHEMTRKELKAAIPQRLEAMSISRKLMSCIYEKNLADHRRELRLALKPRLKKGTNIYIFHREEAERLRGLIEKDLRYLKAHEEIMERYRRDIVKIRKLLEAPFEEIIGGLKATPLKKICRIHLLDPATGRRMIRPGDKTLYRRTKS